MRSDQSAAETATGLGRNTKRQPARLRNQHAFDARPVDEAEKKLDGAIARLGALTRRDLEDRWEDISQGMAGRLMAIEQKDGVFLFAEKSVRPVVNDAQHTNGGLSSDKQSAELSSTWPRDVPRSGSPRSSDLQTATDTHLGPSSGC